MPVFRKDTFGRAWVLLSPERGLLPSDFGSVPEAPELSPLSPGSRGPREIASFGDESGSGAWLTRVVEYPGDPLSDSGFTAKGDDLFRHGPAAGYQEIVVEHRDARQTLESMPRGHVVDVLRLYRDRIALRAALPDVRHVQLNRNVGRAAGARYDHPHAHLLALPVPNRWIEEELEAGREHAAAGGSCLYCDVIASELASRERVVTANAEFVALAPFASRTPFETWVVPRRHAPAFVDVPANHLALLADILQDVLRAISIALDRPPYNMALHTALSAGAPGFHWHFEVLPRLTSQAGFDWGAGLFVNPTPPEDAARFLREALALREVAS